jgi:hypothetical protein
VFVWSDDGVLDGSRFVTSGGGVGIPGGLEGTQTQESSPTDVVAKKKTVAFALRSPDAARVGLLAVNGPQAGRVTTTASVAGPIKLPKRLMCVGVRYAVVALQPTLGWVSNGAGVVKTAAGKGKGCKKPPVMKAGKKKVVVSLATVASGGFHVVIPASARGLGIATAQIVAGKTVLAAGEPLAVLRSGKFKLDLVLPPALRRPGTYNVRVVGKAIVGKKTRMVTLTLEVRA